MSVLQLIIKFKIKSWNFKRETMIIVYLKALLLRTRWRLTPSSISLFLLLLLLLLILLFCSSSRIPSAPAPPFLLPPPLCVIFKVGNEISWKRTGLNDEVDEHFFSCTQQPWIQELFDKAHIIGDLKTKIGRVVRDSSLHLLLLLLLPRSLNTVCQI